MRDWTRYGRTVSGRLRLCQGLAIVPFENGLLLAGGPRRHVFRGRAAVDVLPKLLPRLEAAEPLDEIMGVLGLSEGQLNQAVDILDERGLIEIVPESGILPLTEPETFFSRRHGRTGGYPGGHAVLRAVGAGTVGIWGPHQVTGGIAEDLQNTGVGRVFTAGRDPAAAQGLAGLDGQVLALVVEDGASPGLLSEVTTACAPFRVPVLRCSVSADAFELGPYFMPPATACPACFEQSRRERGWADHAPVRWEGGAAVLAALATTEALSMLARLPDVSEQRTLLRLPVGGGAASRWFIAPYSACEWCGSRVYGASGHAEIGDVYAWSVAAVPPTLTAGRALNRADQSGMSALEAARADYPAHPRRRLPPGRIPLPGVFNEPSAGEHDVADVALIASLLRMTVGYADGDGTGPGTLRYTASGGNAGSVEMLWIAREAAPGLPGNVYRYSDNEHALVAGSPDPVPVDELLRHIDLQMTSTPAVLVLLGQHGRLEPKYTQFAPQLALLDSGCAAAQLAALADAYGLRAEFALGWSDRVAEILPIDSRHEFVAAVIGLSSLGKPPERSTVAGV